MEHRTQTLILLTMFGLATAMAQNNLLDTSSWTVGTGSATGFTKVGSDAENVRLEGTDPFGGSSVLWRATPDASSNDDGGWNTPYLPIDHTGTYRLTVWIKKTNSNGGDTRFGFSSHDTSNAQTNLETNGVSVKNPFFLNGDLPSLDKWYLLVGFVHGSGHTGTGTLSGIYDPVTGTKVAAAPTDYRFAPTAVALRHRAFLKKTTNTSDHQYMYGPTLYEVNGSEPSIAELMSASPPPPTGDTVWATDGQDAYYDAGNVAIGRTTAPSGYRLAVEGHVRAREVRVDQDDWPDYVFTKGYDLPTLEEIQRHIEEKGHLPNMPSAREVEENGVELGEMDKLLLEKIEELTLYVLEQEKELQQQKIQNRSLEEKIGKLEKMMVPNHYEKETTNHQPATKNHQPPTNNQFHE